MKASVAAWCGRRAGGIVLFCGLWVSSATAQSYTNRSSVLDGAGSWSSGGSYSNLSAAAQPGGIAVSSGGGYVNYAGFLNTFLLKPGLDSDTDGLADENDSDNDNDSLTDLAEISGSSFSPPTATDVNNPDADDDDVTDGEESVAGTDPKDGEANLRIVSIDRSGSNPEVQWIARQGKEYRLRGSDGSYSPPQSVVGVSTGGLANGPWFATTNTYVDLTAPPTGRFYAVETAP